MLINKVSLVLGNKSLTAKIIIVFCILFIILIRTRTINEPFERDIGTYAVYGHEMLHGKNLYSYLFDQKPPLLYLTYAGFELLFGYGVTYIYIIGVTFAVVTLVLIYKIGKLVSKKAGIIAVISWTLISSNIPLQANQPNVEVFMNTFLMAGLYLFITHEKKLTLKVGILIGLAFGLSSLYKHITIVPVILLCAMYFFRNYRLSIRDRIIKILPIILVPLALWVLLFGYYYFFDDFKSFYFAVFKFNAAYSSYIQFVTRTSNPLYNIIYGLQPRLIFTLKFLTMLPFIAFALVGVLIGIIKHKMHWLYLATYSVGVFIMVALPGKWYPHYFQLWLPVFCIGNGWFISEIHSKIAHRHKLILIPFITSIFIGVAILQIKPYFLNPEEISVRKYGTVYVEARKNAIKVGTLLRNEETFYQFGSEPEQYLYTKKRLPSGITFLSQLDFDHDTVMLSSRLIRDLDASQPILVLINDIKAFGAIRNGTYQYNDVYSPFMTWLNNNYIENRNYGLYIWVKKASRLDSTNNL